MARATISVQSLFAEFCGLVGYELDATLNPDGVPAQTQTQLLRCWNLAYRRVYDLYPWEDAWQEGTLTPTNGLLNYNDLGDAHIWNLYSADPRVQGATVSWIAGSTAAAGITVGTSFTTLFGFWKPVCPQFVLTDTSSSTAQVIKCLREPVLSYAEAAWMRQAGQYQTAASRENDGDAQADNLQDLEFPRLQTKWWLRRQDA